MVATTAVNLNTEFKWGHISLLLYAVTRHVVSMHDCRKALFSLEIRNMKG